ncbi:PH domain-containing protein [Eupransor demetentiae]|uniref:Bacterial Pleckstrin homology domain-containing protein n=1 Tax=Eupransor demetentiae TaxID=3109584 RepID=A0ABM9N428_9LACO|nr:hypothetical protein R54876_GBNLAHCA_00468 [Lactobacillaceae bacterium LMG 33000]
MENKVTIQDQNLIVEPTGLSKLASFKNKFIIPLSHVAGATVDPGIMKESAGWRNPGTGLPNYRGGTFEKDHEKSFFNVTTKEEPLVIQLKEEKFIRLVLGVEDPKALAEEINNQIN